MTELPKSTDAFPSREVFLSLRDQAQALVESGVATARVTTFKPSGKYYTEQVWRVPADALGPFDMRRSPDFDLAPGWVAVVEPLEPWGYPHLFHGPKEKTSD